MSDLTWIILLLVFWRIIIQPLIVGYRSADAHKKQQRRKWNTRIMKKFPDLYFLV